MKLGKDVSLLRQGCSIKQDGWKRRSTGLEDSMDRNIAKVSTGQGQ